MKENGNVRRIWVGALRVMALALIAISVYGQEARKIIVQATPAYPEMARRLRLQGTVKVQVVIGADGQIKDTKVMGGSPLLVESTLEALKKWKYAPASSETTAMLEFNFHP
jgi:TonB family protein